VYLQSGGVTANKIARSYLAHTTVRVHSVLQQDE
jgi:hypothetical protein